MSTYEPYVHLAAGVENNSHRSVVIAPYSENHAVVAQDAGVRESLSNFSRRGPVGLSDGLTLFPQRVLRVRVAPPEIAESVFGENSQSRLSRPTCLR